MAVRKVVVARVAECSCIEQLRLDWESLLLAYGEPSFFLTWLWIGNWINILPSGVCLYRVTVYRDDVPEALALVTRQKIRRNGLFSSRVLALNESLLNGFDMVVEYNNFVGNVSCRDVNRLMLSGLQGQLGAWDELQLSAIPEDCSFLEGSVLNGLKLSLRLVAESDARYVDLAGLRESQISYMNTLGKKTRYKVRRYIRAIERYGPISLTMPASTEEALTLFDELKSLHQVYWQGRGVADAFANPVWERFHRNIIREGFAGGAVQLVKVCAGAEVVGVVYSLLASGAVNMIQSGYNYHLFSDDHPGYVCLVKVIEYNLDVGNDVFDFLVGDAQYKQSLATDTTKMKWFMLQRRRVKLSVENLLRRLKQRLSAGCC